MTVEGPSSASVAYIHRIMRTFPGADGLLPVGVRQLTDERLLAYFMLTHHYCRDGVVRAALGSTLTPSAGWDALSDKADEVVRYELVSDVAFAKMLEVLEERRFVAELLLHRMI